jgi:MoxR-like ATPase
MDKDTLDRAHENIKKITANITGVITDRDDTIRKLLAAFLSGGHVLLEDMPGTGKTMLARAFSKSIDADFKRIQFTPDLLPSDIVGISMFDPELRKFHFRRGPVFSNIVLADEINRASPRTQSAMLECMGERQVTVDEKSYTLADPFLVVATQNPVEFHGTYPLPEALLDRFSVKLGMGYVSVEKETAIITAQMQTHPIDSVRAVITKDEAVELRALARRVHISAELCRYVVELASATRGRRDVKLGAGPRASIALMNISRSLALCDGSGFVNPDHIRDAARPVLAHRLVLDPQSRFEGVSANDIVEDVIKSVNCPA